MTSLSNESRLILMRDALRGLTQEEAQKLVDDVLTGFEVEQKPSSKKRFDPLNCQNPVKLLNWQIDLAIERNIQHLYGMNEREFRLHLKPLLKTAASLPKVKPPTIPCLLVFPSKSMPPIPRRKTMEEKRAFLYRSLAFNGQKLDFYDSPESYEDKVPQELDKPYLATKVEMGVDLAGLHWKDEGDDPALQVLNERGRQALNLDEVLFLSLLSPSLIATLPGIRIPGTKYCEDNMDAALIVDKGKLKFTDIATKDLWNVNYDAYGFDFPVPSCVDRIV